MRSLLGFGGVTVHYNQFRLLGLNSRRFRLSNPFLQFYNGLVGIGGEAYIAKGKVGNQGESQSTECKKLRTKIHILEEKWLCKRSSPSNCL